MISRLGATLLLIAMATGCSSTRLALPTTTPDLGHSLAKKVTAEGMLTHLRA